MKLLIRSYKLIYFLKVNNNHLKHKNNQNLNILKDIYWPNYVIYIIDIPESQYAFECVFTN